MNRPKVCLFLEGRGFKPLDLRHEEQATAGPSEAQQENRASLSWRASKAARQERPQRPKLRSGTRGGDKGRRDHGRWLQWCGAAQRSGILSGRRFQRSRILAGRAAVGSPSKGDSDTRQGVCRTAFRTGVSDFLAPPATSGARTRGGSYALVSASQTTFRTTRSGRCESGQAMQCGSGWNGSARRSPRVGIIDRAQTAGPKTYRERLWASVPRAHRERSDVAAFSGRRMAIDEIKPLVAKTPGSCCFHGLGDIVGDRRGPS